MNADNDCHGFVNEYECIMTLFIKKADQSELVVISKSLARLQFLSTREMFE